MGRFEDRVARDLADPQFAMGYASVDLEMAAQGVFLGRPPVMIYQATGLIYSSFDENTPRNTTGWVPANA